MAETLASSVAAASAYSHQCFVQTLVGNLFHSTSQWNAQCRHDYFSSEKNPSNILSIAKLSSGSRQPEESHATTARRRLFLRDIVASRDAAASRDNKSGMAQNNNHFNNGQGLFIFASIIWKFHLSGPGWERFTSQDGREPPRAKYGKLQLVI